MELETFQYHLEAMKKMFGEQLPNPEHYPLQFHYFLNLYVYYLKRKSATTQLIPSE